MEPEDTKLRDGVYFCNVLLMQYQEALQLKIKGKKFKKAVEKLVRWYKRYHQKNDIWRYKSTKLNAIHAASWCLYCVYLHNNSQQSFELNRSDIKLMRLLVEPWENWEPETRNDQRLYELLGIIGQIAFMRLWEAEVVNSKSEQFEQFVDFEGPEDFQPEKPTPEEVLKEAEEILKNRKRKHR